MRKHYKHILTVIKISILYLIKVKYIADSEVTPEIIRILHKKINNFCTQKKLAYCVSTETDDKIIHI